MKIEIENHEIKNLKLIRSYFGEHDKSQLEQFAYKVIDNLIKKCENKSILKDNICECVYEYNDDHYELLVYKCINCLKINEHENN